MIIIFDLDYTILDTKKFKEDLASVFNMSVEEFNKSYFDNFKSKNINYSIDKHLIILKEEGAVKEKRIAEMKARFNEFIKNIDKYLFPGAKEIMESLKSQDNELALATFGDIGWQKLKVDGLKLEKYFDRIIYEDKNKKENPELEALRESGKEIAIINDNARESKELKGVLGENCEIKLIRGPYSDNSYYEEKVFKNLGEAFEEREHDETSRELVGVR